MNTSIFTKNFYTKLYDELVGQVQGNDSHYEDICEGKSIALDCNVDDKYVTCEVCFSTEYVDESFDHLFGTWHDPSPYCEAIGIEDITDVHVYESEDMDTPEIEGFSYDDFWSPYEKDTYLLNNGKGKFVSVKAGDKVVLYGSHEVEFLAYNYQKESCKVRYEDGSTHYVQWRFLKAQEKASAA